jgi:hypothetical protein
MSAGADLRVGSLVNEVLMKLRIMAVQLFAVMSSSGRISAAQSVAQKMQEAVTADSKHYSVEFEK